MNRARRRVSVRQVFFSWWMVGEVLYLASQACACRHPAIFFDVIYLGDPANDVGLTVDIGLANSNPPNNVKLAETLAGAGYCAGAVGSVKTDLRPSSRTYISNGGRTC